LNVDKRGVLIKKIDLSFDVFFIEKILSLPIVVGSIFLIVGYFDLYLLQICFY
jgi:hypothetical protein